MSKLLSSRLMVACSLTHRIGRKPWFARSLKCVFTEIYIRLLTIHLILNSLFMGKYLFKSRCIIGCFRLWRYSIPLATSTAIINLDCKSRILKFKNRFNGDEIVKPITYLKKIKWYVWFFHCVILDFFSLLKVKLKIWQIWKK